MTFPDQLLAIMAEIAPMNRVFVSNDYSDALSKLQTVLDFRIHEFPADDVVNHWVIPPSWNLIEAKIIKDGETIYDACDNILKVISLSLPFQGVVSLDELKKHLFYDHRTRRAIPFHFRQLYRPWERDWGFSVTEDFYDSLQSGHYEVSIKTNEFSAPLKIADYILPGKSNRMIAIVAHLDHPGQANDDLSGVMVGIRIMQLLKQRERIFSYRLVLVQEIIGSVYYLNALKSTGEILDIVSSVFLEMLGTNTQIGLQLSYKSTSPIDLALSNFLNEERIPHTLAKFREIIGNDESVWEAHGISLERGCVVRCGNSQHHSCDELG